MRFSLFRRCLDIGSLLFAACITHAPCSVATELETQRALYNATMRALDRGEVATFRRNRQALADYPLYPYLELRELRRRLSSLPMEDVDAFLLRHGRDLPAVQLREDWLRLLESRGRWQDYLRFYQNDSGNDEKRCTHAWALERAGRSEEAFAETAELWLSPKSMPKKCDPMFQRWYAALNPSPDMAWRRFHLAMEANQPALAGYLRRFLDAERTRDADTYQRVHDNPALLRNSAGFGADNPRNSDIAQHGLVRLGYRDPVAAARAFSVLRTSRVLHDDSARAVAPRLASALAAKSADSALQFVLGLDPALREGRIAEDAVRYALRSAEWNNVMAALQLLPQELAVSERWDYWHARAEEQSGSDAERENARRRFDALRLKRSFYGFLAADRLSSPYAMSDQPVAVSEAELDATRRQPGLSRARERFLRGETGESRREWWYALKIMSDRERLAAARIGAEWGWHQLSIWALINAREWDDLKLRFPLLYTEQFRSAAKRQKLDHNWLYAIARQESAFNPTIRSPAGAVGLMQLMPATARDTARGSGIRYRGTSDLLNPATNVALGSRYMRLMLDRFQQNRVLAAAAYNAGPHRVRTWLQRLPARVEPDLFVETISFDETRQYVQNVLSFAVIYAYLQGHSTPMLAESEKLIRNPFAPASAG